MPRERLRILGIVDLHWSGSGPLRLPELAGIDLVLLGGDITNFRGREVARRVVEEIQAAGPRVLAACGNCDKPEIESYLTEAGVGLDRRAVEIGGVKFLGLSAGLPFGGCPYERTEERFADACRELWSAARKVEASGPTIFMTHQPPYGTRCDRARGQHVGSHSVRAAIEEHQPDLVFCGHIHEAIGEDYIGRSRIINPGPWKSGHCLQFEVFAGQVTSVKMV